MTGAAYRSSARDALTSAAGRAALLINVTSRENDLFDFLYECLIPRPERGDRAIGAGIEAENAVTLQLDNPETLAALARMGHPLDAPRKRICHWSSYTRPGVLRLYNDVLRRPDHWTLKALKHAEHPRAQPRWSRLVHRPPAELPLFPAQKAS
jgi:hypothetical protein